MSAECEIRDNGPEYQADRDGRGGRSAIAAMLRNTGACRPAERDRLDRLHCKARLRAYPGIRRVRCSGDLCAPAQASGLPREDAAAQLA